MEIGQQTKKGWQKKLWFSNCNKEIIFGTQMWYEDNQNLIESHETSLVAEQNHINPQHSLSLTICFEKKSVLHLGKTALKPTHPPFCCLISRSTLTQSYYLSHFFHIWVILCGLYEIKITFSRGSRVHYYSTLPPARSCTFPMRSYGSPHSHML